MIIARICFSICIGMASIIITSTLLKTLGKSAMKGAKLLDDLIRKKLNL